MPIISSRDISRKRRQNQKFASPTPWNDAIDLDVVNEMESQETTDERIEVDLDGMRHRVAYSPHI